MRVSAYNAVLLLCALSAVTTASAQSDSDTCHVYVVDVKATRQFRAKADLDSLTKKSREEQEKLIEVAGLGKQFEEFPTTVGEEEMTTKTYVMPRSKLVITASVFYTDESMASKGHQDSMLLAISVGPKAADNALSASDAAVAELSYGENVDAVRVKKHVIVSGRLYVVGLECRCKK